MTVTVTVERMACDGCEESVESALEGIEGVTAADADHERGTATAEGDADVDALVAAVEDAGYPAEA